MHVSQDLRFFQGQPPLLDASIEQVILDGKEERLTPENIQLVTDAFYAYLQQKQLYPEYDVPVLTATTREVDEEAFVINATPAPPSFIEAAANLTFAIDTTQIRAIIKNVRRNPQNQEPASSIIPRFSAKRLWF